MSEQHDTIDALMAENRTFPPPDSFKAQALVVGTFLYDEAARDEFDPVAALERVEDPGTGPEATDDPQQQVGEASWTSGFSPEQIPERSR